MGRYTNHKEINWYLSLTTILWDGSCFPISLGTPVMNLLQELQVEPNDIQRRINQTIHLQQTREEVYIKCQVVQERIKKIFDKGPRLRISTLVTKS